MTDIIEFYIIEMPKVKKYAKNSKLDTWVKYIMNSEDVDMDKADEEIKQAHKVLEEISKDENERYLAELREKYIIEINTMKSEGLAEGKAMGLAEGKAMGLAEGKKTKAIEIARLLLKDKNDIEYVMKITGLTKEEIEKL